MLGEQLRDSALPLELKQGLLQIAAIAIGTAAGGGSVAGAAAAQNATANNYLMHTEINKLVASNKACSNGDKQACADGKALNVLDEKRQQALSDCQGQNTPACNGVRSDAADAMQGLSLYKEEIKKLVASGEISANAAQTYLNKADTEIKDVAYHLKDDYYVKSGGVADPKSADYIKYKILDSATNGQELGGALTGAPTAGPSEKTMGKVNESNKTSTNNVPDYVTRSDNNFTSPINERGQPKAFINADGNLMPANINGTGDIKSHVRGGNSQDTPFISTTDLSRLLKYPPILVHRPARSHVTKS
jgi:filamentous hemagglutinin